MTSPAALSASKRKRIAQRFDAAMSYQRAGNLGEAERCLARVIATDPAHAPALHCLALLVQRRGEADEALALMQRAARGHDTDASVFNNLANMLREAGRADEALGAYQQAVTHDPANLNAHFNLAGALLNSGDAVGARAAFEKVLRASPRDPGALDGMGQALLAIDEAGAAVRQFQVLTEVVPDEPGAWVSLCRALLAADRAADALSTARAALARLPDTPALLLQQAELQSVLGHHQEAGQSYQASLSIDPRSLDAWLGLGRSLLAEGREQPALDLCKDMFERFGAVADIHMVKGIALKQLGRFDEAALELERAVAIEPDFAEAWNSLGMTKGDLGDRAAAQCCFERALSLRPDSPQTVFNLFRMRRIGDEDRPRLVQLQRQARQRSRPIDERVYLNFALGKAFDDLRDTDLAFEHYAMGNALKARSMPFDAAAFRLWVQSLQATFSADFFRRCEGFGLVSERPVFIVGVPRSGTSLVEQILASHPRVFGAGELTLVMDFAASLPARLASESQDPSAANLLTREAAGELGGEYLAAIAKLDADAVRVTDKMPNNFFYLGLIAALLPKARVIHCVRDPMDSCFSNFIQLFGALHHYSYDLKHTAVYYNEYRRIMAHWDEVLPLSVHTVSYESLVDDTRAQTAAMLDFLGLPFDESCVEFHQTQRAVGTASHWQVRQPIYRTSRMRWRRYAPHLRELAAAIGYDMDAAQC